MPKAAVPCWGVPREGLGMVQDGVSGDGVQAASTTPPIMVFAAAAARSASAAAGVALAAVGDAAGRVAAGLAVGDAAAPVREGTGDAVPPSSFPPAHAARARAIPTSRATDAGLNTVPAILPHRGMAATTGSERGLWWQRQDSFGMAGCFDGDPDRDYNRSVQCDTEHQLSSVFMTTPAKPGVMSDPNVRRAMGTLSPAS
jgi:hypothetical protein